MTTALPSSWVGDHNPPFTVFSNSLALVLLLFSVCFLPAQPPTSNYRISGRVTNATTSEPIRAATLSLHNEDGTEVLSTTLSDAEGNFAFDHLPAGKFPLAASKRGFRTAFYDEHDDFNSAIVTGPNQDTTHLAFQLKAAAVLFGVVTADGGDPVGEASIMLFKNPASPGQPVANIGATTTDDTGFYEFGDLPAASYFIALQAKPWYAVHTGASQGNEQLDVSYPLTFFDSVTQESAASPITLAYGDRQQANIALHAVRSVHLKVHTGANGTAGPVGVHRVAFGIPLPGSDLESVPDQPGSTAIQATGAPGNYVVNHGAPARMLDINAAADTDIDTDQGSPTVIVSGTVQTTTGSPLEFGVVQLDPEQDPPGRVSLGAPLVKGTFQIDGVSTGRWKLSVSAAEGPQGQPQHDVAVISVSDVNHRDAGNAITVADHPLNLTVQVSRSQTKVQGFARLGNKPAPGVMILLVPSDPRAYSALVRRDQSDTDGSFNLRDVAAGRYTVIALQKGWNLDWQHRHNIARFLSTGVPVEVPEGAAPMVRLNSPVQAVQP